MTDLFLDRIKGRLVVWQLVGGIYCPLRFWEWAGYRFLTDVVRMPERIAGIIALGFERERP